MKTPYLSGNGDCNAAISLMTREVLQPQSGFRGNNTKVVILTGGNITSNLTELSISVQLVKIHAEIFVVAVSASVNPSVISSIASSPLALHTRFLQTPLYFTLEEEYESLSSLLRDCNQDLCESNSTDIIFLFDASDHSALFWRQYINFAIDFIKEASFINSNIRFVNQLIFSQN